MNLESAGDASSIDPRWFTDDEFWGAVAPVLFGAAGVRAAEAEALELVDALALEPGSTILDVFCGPGRLARPLVDLGYHIVGVDRTDRYLAAAKDAERVRTDDAVPEAGSGSGSGHDPPNGSAVYHRVEFTSDGRGDDADVAIRPADAAIWAGLSTGYAGAEFDRAVLKWIRHRLRPGSPLLIEVSTLEDLRDPGFEVIEWFEDRGRDQGEADAVWRLRHSLVESAVQGDWFEGVWTRFRLGLVDEYRFRYQIHSRERWVALLNEAGFVGVRFEDHLEGFGREQRSVARPRERAQSWIQAGTPT